LLVIRVLVNLYRVKFLLKVIHVALLKVVDCHLACFVGVKESDVCPHERPVVRTVV
jgi:hypothetical protein